jgi:hypothetical protein
MIIYRHSKFLDIVETTEIATGLKTRAPRYRVPASMMTDSQPAPAPTGFFSAVIAKTTDAGETWTVQFNDTKNEFYFNDISCATADACVAVGESGDGSPALGNRIYATKDGGATWTMTHNDQGGQFGCSGIRMTSATDATAACTEAISQFKINAMFLTSTDGGFTWTVANVPGGSPTDLDMSSSTSGYATGA